MRATRRRARIIACTLGLVFSAAARPATAETLSLMWDASADSSVAGYMVYIGTQPGAPATAYDVGSNRSFEWDGAIDGQQYYFSVAAYSAGPVIGPRSPEISRYPNGAPTLYNPGSQTAVIGTVTSLQLTGSDPEGNSLTFGASGLPPGLQLISGTGLISGTPSTVGSFTVTATVTDGVQSDAKTFIWSVLQPSADGSTTITPPSQQTHGDTTTTQHGGSTTPVNTNLAPTLVNPGAQSATQGTPVSLQLSGSDPEGATLTFGASNLPPGLQLSAGTGKIWGSPAKAGLWTVTATVTDGALSDAKTFTWVIDEPARDTVAPVITVVVPTAAATFATSDAVLTVGGEAADSGGVASVTWVTDRGMSGTATGTQNWIAAVPLSPGSNTITVTARDQAGNVAQRSLVVKASFKTYRDQRDVKHR